MSRATGAAADLLYEGLARYQWLRRRLRRPAAGEALELRKRIVPPPPGQAGPDGPQGLPEWLWQQAGLAGEPRVLEVGCGFGANVLRWASAHGGRFVGLGNSRFQIEHARSEAARLGLGARCQFVHQSYDQPIAGPFDAVAAVEALLHARDLAATLGNLARCLAPAGRLIALEDVARTEAVAADEDARALCAAWGASRLWSEADWERAAAAAGLRVASTIDLTAQVPLRPERALRRAERALRALHFVLPGRRARGTVAAFLGGIALERLYRKGAAAYCCLVLAKEARP